jgi:hypothetical protein
VTGAVSESAPCLPTPFFADYTIVYSNKSTPDSKKRLRVDAMENDPRSIIEQIKDYKRRIDVVDTRLRKYVQDRTKYPHPDHEKLIEEIRKYENRVYRIRNSEVQMRLEGLMHSLMVHERIWRKLLDQR